MSKCRMVSECVLRRDDYLDMPISARELYVQLVLDADDDGFIDNPRTVLRVVGASMDDLKLLLAKGFLIAFRSGIVVVVHWRLQNRIRSDRYKPTIFTDEKALLVEENRIYYLASEKTSGHLLDGCHTISDNKGTAVGMTSGYQIDTNGIPSVNQRYAQDRTRENKKEKIGEDITPPLPPKGGKNHKVDKPDDSDLSVFTGELLEAVRDWFAYKNEKRQSYKPTGRKTLLKQIRAKADKYGEMNVAALIRDSMASNYQGIVWDRLGRRQTRASSAPVEYGDPADFYK